MLSVVSIGNAFILNAVSFSILFIFVFIIGILIKYIVQSVRSFRILTYVNDKMNILLVNSDMMFVDFKELESPTFEIYSQGKEKSTLPANLELIGETFSKGYDFIVANFPKNYETPIHKHSQSSEFFYVISGEVKITQVLKNEQIDVLSEGDCLFVNRNTFHIVESKVPSKVILIAKPSIYRKIPILAWIINHL